MSESEVKEFEESTLVTLLCALVPFALLGIATLAIGALYFISRAGIGFE